jgi:ribonuclease VapC
LIVIDSSALFAIILEEPENVRCSEAIESADKLLMSAATLTECLVVASGKNLFNEMAAFLNALDLTVVPLSEQRAFDAGNSHRRWGKGRHPAKLNYGDSFAYALAKEFDYPLLFVGNDFALTDVEAA